MAKRDRRKKYTRAEERLRESADTNPPLHPETQRGIGIVLVFAFAALFVFGLFDQAGSVGHILNTALRQMFGWGRFVVPLFLFGWGYMLVRPKKYVLSTANYLGGLIFILSFSALLHIFIPSGDSLSAIPEGRGGGYLGYVLSAPFHSLMGFGASLVVILALCLISILIMLNTSLESLLRRRPPALTDALGKIRGYSQTGEETSDGDAESIINDNEPTEEDQPTKFSIKQPIFNSTKTDNENAPATELAPQIKRRRKPDMPLDLLETKTAQPTSGDINGNLEKIRRTLDSFGISVEMGEVKVGPTVTQYTLRPADGVKLASITGLSNDLALALAAHPIRIEAPIPGKSLVGLEVPNQRIAIVGLRGILESEEFKKRTSNLSIVLGRDVAGNPIVVQLDKMPHMLIAGATGSGKSVCIHSVIVSLLYQNSPDTLQFILVDPKKVELISYNDVPHLLTPVITEVDKTINAMKWLVGEMDRRYRLLAEAGKKNIAQYNGSVLVNQLPYIVVIIDELADLMVQAAQEVEGIIIRLAQMARAVGIHLIVSTQRPSVDVITGLIKANITSRIAFSVASLMDSRTILDYSGAEKLLGRGDMLYISSELSKPRRIQGALVTEEEIERVTNYLKKQSEPNYIDNVTDKPTSAMAGSLEALEDDELMASAKEVIWQANKASASLLQRRLRIGYARAARLLDLLEQEGIIGPGDGAKPRDILIQRSDYDGASADSSTENDLDEDEDKD
jgi:S-DNA-T family DNA segregation ATPase FtsK/SpoIIIE